VKSRQQAVRPGRGRADARPGGLGGWYEVDGRRLWLHRDGTGDPAVVFLPGASAVGLDYLNLHRQTAQLATSVLYDRGGTGWSDPAQLPRSAEAVATELRDLLHTAGITGPYLLVAHSLGGAYARRFGQLYPAELSGIAYADAFYEENDAFMPERLQLAKLRQPNPGPLAQLLIRPFARRMYAQMLATWPEPLRGQLIEAHVSAEWWQVGVLERSNMADLAAELKRGGTVPDVPSIVLSPEGVDPGLRLFMSGRAIREMAAAGRRRNDALAASVSRGDNRVLSDARHSTITTDRSDAVLQAIADLIDMTRQQR
jgi:pimeloyl-ACP methyl ester carboxylesterase